MLNERESNQVTFVVWLFGLFLVTFIGRHISPPKRLDPAELYDLRNAFITEEECAELARMYDGKVMAPKECGENVPLTIDYRNIFSPVIAYDNDGNEIPSFHHDYQGRAQKSSLIKLRKIKEYPDGTYEAEWSYA